MKEHNLKTLEDIIKVVNKDNADNFLIDFGNWIKLRVLVKKANKELGKIVELKTDSTFMWTDDGKNEITLKFINKKDISKKL